MLYLMQEVPPVGGSASFWLMLLFMAVIIWLVVKIVDHFIDRWKK